MRAEYHSTDKKSPESWSCGCVPPDNDHIFEMSEREGETRGTHNLK